MVVDVARSFNGNAHNIDVEILPPRCSHLVRAARHLMASSNGGSDKKNLEDVNEIRQMLDTLKRRWRLAGKSASWVG